MRRSDREITDRENIDGIIRRCPICHLALCDEGQPYVVPLNFGYDGERIFFHCAVEGRKVDIVRKNPRVCVEFAIPGAIAKGEQACDWGSTFESVIAFGQARILDQPDEKRTALACIMEQYSNESWTFPDDMVARTCCIAVSVEEITGKRK